MKKLLTSAVALLILLSGCSSIETPTDKVKVVASFYPLAQFASYLGGDLVEVINLVPTGEEVHGFELTPKNRADIESSKLFIYNGLGLESWVEDVTASLSKVNVVDSSQGIQALKANEVHEEHADHEDDDHDHDHEHGEFDPHIWLSPVNAKIQLKNILDGLVKADPEHAETYQKNYEGYATKLDELNQEYVQGLSQLDSRKIVTSHQAFAYLAHQYNLEQVAISGINDESEPDPQAMISVIEYIKANHLKVIFVGEQVSSKVSEQIANETGARLEVLNTIEGLTAEQASAKEDYFSLMKKNLETLKKALS